jgi:NAD(P)-dependent dehydrogenase (short-subunit alcohol dehydrogenase family)
MRRLRGLWIVMALGLTQAVDAATVLVTGANSGVGLEFARQYAAAGWTVIAVHRRDTTPDTLEALMKQYKNVRAERMDVTSPDEVHALAQKLKDVPIDVLINNAAVYADHGDWSTQQFGHLDYHFGETVLTTNVLGPLLVSEAFQPQINAGQKKKVVSITSTHASLTQPIAGDGAIFYRASKAALNRSMMVVADVLRPQGVTVLLIHPGSVRKSDLEPKTSKLGPRIDIAETVHDMIKTIDTTSLKDSGHFLLYDGTQLAW